MRSWLALASALLACTFDSAGQGNENGEPPATTVPAATTGAETGASGGPDGATSGGGSQAGSSGGPGSSGDAATSQPVDPTTSGETTLLDPSTTLPDPSTTGAPDPSTTGAPDPACLGPVPPLEVLVEDAELEFPMVEENSQMGEGKIASSGILELGTAEFAFAVPCQDDWAVWARVYDGWDGTHQSDDPDSYYLRVDGGGEITWFYGCQTFGATQDWGWRRVRALDGGSCDDYVDWTLPLAPGVHHVRLRNREGERGGGVRAAVARVLLSNDPNFVPPDP